MSLALLRRPLRALAPAPRPARRAARAAPARAESNFGEDGRPPPLAVILGCGTGFMVNAATFGAAYKVLPEMRILSYMLEEVQAPELHTLMAKLGILLASPADIFLLTICLALIEVRRWLDE